MLVTGKSSYELSGAKAVCNHILASERCIRFSDFSVNPKLSDAIKGCEIARENNVDFIIAVGGGSVLDIAKLIKALFRSHGNELETAIGEDRVIDPKIPIIAIPTTAGSGSEATHFAVVYIGEEKYSLASKCLEPDAVILDGSLVTSGNEYLKTCNGLDAMAQAIESYWAVGATDESRQYALSALKLGWEVFPKYTSVNCSPIDAQKMIESANLAGKAINISKTTAAHAWSYAFTSGFAVPHGHAVWLTLPKIFQLHFQYVSDVKGKSNDTMMELINLMNLDPDKMLDKQLEDFLVTLSIAETAEKLDISSNDRISLSTKVNMQRMANNPVQFTEKDIREIFAI